MSADGTSPAAAIEARGLGKDYGSLRAVDSLDLTVAPGEFFGFLGPNGAGKTTTIRMLTTLLRPTRGAALVHGFDVRERPREVRRRMGLVFQETTLDLDLTAEENLRFAARLYGLGRREAQLRIDEALALFGLLDRRHERVRTFSGGMRRALDIARGILHRPSVLFLDEPTLGLDPVQRRNIWTFLGGFSKELGTTLFLTTHYLEEADACDRVAIVDHGRLIALGTPEELKRSLGREAVEVELPAESDGIADEVRRLAGVDANASGRAFTLNVVDPTDVVARLLPLTDRGVRVAVRPPSLEDVFVALTAGQHPEDT